MFDNEIDWVMRLEMLRVRREAREPRKILNTFEYKAEHKHVSWCKLLTQASVQVRRVSLGVWRLHARARKASLRGGEIG